MKIESAFSAGEVEPRGALCVECIGTVAPTEALLDRCGAALCRACAAEFYAPCAACRGLVPRDEARERADAPGALLCAECFRAPAAGADPPPGDEEVEALVARYVALHAEKKKLDAELDDIKDRLKLAAGARERVAGAVVFRAGDGGVRCSYSTRTAWDASKLLEVESLIGRDEFDAMFERKVTFTALRERLDQFLAADDAALAAARDLLRSAAQESETATLNVVAPKKGKRQNGEKG